MALTPSCWQGVRESKPVNSVVHTDLCAATTDKVLRACSSFLSFVQGVSRSEILSFVKVSEHLAEIRCSYVLQRCLALFQSARFDRKHARWGVGICTTQLKCS